MSGIRAQGFFSPRGDKSNNKLLEFKKPKINKKPDLRDFKVQHLIGKGSFGKVFLVVNDQDGKTYAMKVIRKDQMLS